MFLDMKNELLRLKAERGPGMVNPAQTAWEELHVRMYLTQLEGLATTLRATSLARRDTAAPQATAMYLQARSRAHATPSVVEAPAASVTRRRRRVRRRGTR